MDNLNYVTKDEQEIIAYWKPFFPHPHIYFYIVNIKPDLLLAVKRFVFRMRQQMFELSSMGLFVCFKKESVKTEYFIFSYKEERLALKVI